MGELQVVCGPMFSGKTEELLRRLRRAEIAKQNIVLVRPAIDTRSEEGIVLTHNGTKMPSIVAKNSSFVLDLAQYYDVIGIDEVQFFNRDLIDVILYLTRQRVVICSGLDTNYRYEPFGIVPELMAYAEKVDKLTAICNSCGNEATRTQRLINGKPASFSGDEIMIGGLETYQARCRNCFQIA
jgi:thymidine kinase